MPKLKVLLLTSIPYGPYDPVHKPDDGPDRHAATRALAALGIEVRTIGPYPFPWNPLAGQHPLLQSLDPLRTLQALWIGRRYDFVISGNDGPAAPLVLLRRLFRLRTPILIWDLSPGGNWRLRARLQNMTLPKVDGILALPSSQEAYIHEHWGSHLKVIALQYFIDTDFYRPRTVEPGGYVLSVGDDGGRDYATLLAAVERLDIELRIRTSQPLAAGPEGRARIRFVRERLPYAAFRNLYAASDFVVIPLMPDVPYACGYSVFLEASAMGKAIIVADTEGIRDLVRPGDNCLVVPPGDPPALAAAIERLRNDPATCRRLGENARRFIEEVCSPAAFARRFARAMESLRRN